MKQRCSRILCSCHFSITILMLTTCSLVPRSSINPASSYVISWTTFLHPCFFSVVRPLTFQIAHWAALRRETLHLSIPDILVVWLPEGFGHTSSLLILEILKWCLSSPVSFVWATSNLGVSLYFYFWTTTVKSPRRNIANKNKKYLLTIFKWKQIVQFFFLKVWKHKEFIEV